MVIKIRQIKAILWKIVPHIHNLRDVIYIDWFGYEWIIQKKKE